MRLTRSASLLLAAGTLGLLAWLPRPITASVPASPSASEELEEAMSQLNRSIRILSKGVDEASHEKALGELVKMQQAILLAKTQMPDTAEAVDEKKRAAFVGEFRTAMIETLKLVCDTEIAVVNGKYKDAKSLVNKLKQAKTKGHDKFKGEDH